MAVDSEHKVLLAAPTYKLYKPTWLDGSFEIPEKDLKLKMGNLSSQKNTSAK
jgi:hypothetical protein